jgi:hypothetical protein
MILWIFTVMAVLRFMRFATTPFLRRIGYYTYYSPMFFIMPTPTALEIHLGTSYDFFQQNPTPRLVLRYLAQGLVNLCSAIEHGAVDPQRIIKGTVYYINESTLRRFGFEPCDLSLFQWALFLQNYLEVCLLLTLSKRRISFVNLKNVRRIKATSGDLLHYKEKYVAYLRYLENGAYRASGPEDKFNEPHLPAQPLSLPRIP